MPTEEEAKKAIDTLNAAKTHTGGDQVDIGEFLDITQDFINETYEKIKPVLDRLRRHDTGEEEIKTINL